MTDAVKDPQFRTKAEAEVLATIEGMAKAMAKQDLDSVMSVYEKRSMVVFEPGQPVTERSEIRTQFSHIMAAQVQVNFGEHAVFVVGDLAIHLANWSMDGRTPDGTALRDEGLTVGVLRKQVDGRWLFVYDNPHSQQREMAEMAATPELNKSEA